MRRLSLYAFVISLAWLCFLIAIAFIEAPGRFEALNLKKPWTEVTTELKSAVLIGYHSFHKLNVIEWVCCVFSWLLAARVSVVRTRGTMAMLAAVTAILAVETLLLFPVMDQHIKLIVHGTLPPETWHHIAWIIGDGLKAILLAVLSAAQLQSFARAVISE
jgi:hypothetical protein